MLLGEENTEVELTILPKVSTDESEKVLFACLDILINENTTVLIDTSTCVWIECCAMKKPLLLLLYAHNHNNLVLCLDRLKCIASSFARRLMDITTDRIWLVTDLYA